MNIIYFVCHDLGRHLGCYGRRVRTPNIDRFAAESLRFDQAFCQTAVCSPSRGACMTGQCAHKNGLMGLAHFGWRLRPGVKTVVDLFNDAGFETVHCGLSHEGEENRSRYQTDFEVTWRSTQAPQAIDDAIAWLRGRQKQKRTTPFYLNIGTHEVHPTLWRRDEEAPGVPSRFRREVGGPVPEDEVVVPPPTPDIPLTRDEFARFEGAIRFLDRQFGRLLRTIDGLGMGDDTLVIFSTDHGMVDWRGKGSLYDRGTEIALILRPPQGTDSVPGAVGRLVQNTDLAPTLLEATGLPVPADMDGRSFWPLVADGHCEPRERIFSEWNFGGPQDDYSPVRAVRSRRHKLLRNYGPHHYDYYRADEITPDFDHARMNAKRFKNYGPPYQHPERMLPEFELYDLQVDPHELRNLATDSSHAETLRELRESLDDWMRRTDDPLLRGEVPEIPAEPGFHYEE